MSIYEMIATGVALVALLISSVSIYLQQRDRSPRLRVKVWAGVLPEDDEFHGPAILGTVSNVGEKPVIIEEVRVKPLRLPPSQLQWRITMNRFGMAIDDHPEMRPGRSGELTIIIGASSLKQGSLGRVIVTDAAFREYRSNWIRIPSWST